MSEARKLSPVERIFERMSATYMAEWSRKVGQTPIADLMTVWEYELSGFLQTRESMMAVAWALEHLPESAPNVIQFRNLCRQAPAPEAPKLESPKADPAKVAAEIEKLAPLRAAWVSRAVDRDWARVILADVESGAKRSPAVVRMAKDALGIA